MFTQKSVSKFTLVELLIIFLYITFLFFHLEHGSYGGYPSLSPTGQAPGPLGHPLPYKHGLMRRRPNRPKRPKNNQLSAPPDKDPVMLINEYGQKMSLQVKCC